ncbi:MAG: response regulator [Candidatus Aquicultorales bacterium]
MQPIKVFIVDDDEAIRDGISVLLEAQPDMVLVGQAGTRQEAVRFLDLVEADVVLLDLRLPDGDGMDIAREILDGGSKARPIIFTALAGREKEACDLKARFILKGSDLSELFSAIRESVDRGAGLPSSRE